jgi:hypothetical protein
LILDVFFQRIRELREIGFTTRTLHGYGDQPLIAGCVGLLARKTLQ